MFDKTVVLRTSSVVKYMDIMFALDQLVNKVVQISSNKIRKLQELERRKRNAIELKIVGRVLDISLQAMFSSVGTP